MFALAADMTLSHVFLGGSKEERVNVLRRLLNK